MYEVRLQRQALRYYNRCSKNIAERLAACFASLESDPLNPDTKAMKGELKGCRRARVGGLRVVYEVDEDAMIVQVLLISPRGDVYKKI